MNNVYLHRKPRLAGNKDVGSEEHRFETRYHQRPAVYAHLVHVETVTDPPLLAWGPPLPSGKVLASGTKDSRPETRFYRRSDVILDLLHVKPYLGSQSSSRWSRAHPYSLIPRGLFLQAPLKPGVFGRKRHELDSPNMGGYLPHHPAPAITFS
ncbi:hypothetical protein AVEN_260447-1 [Araneus ventricosus]|uniref:Uncharacterized protein n=1 Tax=Araneus ventricosus TaxID=182803 RepID=A0A4Y2ILQ3_ARAVE|nr:hypothetical protein AVEN_260447-1 [Araneus ventricosus]